MKQRVKPDLAKLTRMLDKRTMQILGALGCLKKEELWTVERGMHVQKIVTVPSGQNPVWLAISALNPVSEADIEAFTVDQDGRGSVKAISDEEVAAMRRAAQLGKPLAAKLRDYLWKGGTPNKTGIMMAYLVAQTAAYLDLGGPLGDFEMAAIRQHWYDGTSTEAMGYKYAAQNLEKALLSDADIVLVANDEAKLKAIRAGANAGSIRFKTEWNRTKSEAFRDEHNRQPKVCTVGNQGWGRMYSQQQSELLVKLVESGMTYSELFIEDTTSRPMKAGSPLLYNARNFVLCMEKASLVDQMYGYCRRLGIPYVIGTSGVPAAAFIETFIREQFSDEDGSYKVTRGDPLHVFILVDWDDSGHGPIRDGLVKMFSRYLEDRVKFHHLGVYPAQLRKFGQSVLQSGYEIDIRNQGVQEWCDNNAVWIGDVPYGIEMDAVLPKHYATILARAMWRYVGPDLRDAWKSRTDIEDWRIFTEYQKIAYEYSPLRKMLDALVEWAEYKRNDVDHPLDEAMKQRFQKFRYSNPVREDFEEFRDEYLDDTITLANYTEYVLNRDKSYAWSPVSNTDTQSWMETNYQRQEGTDPTSLPIHIPSESDDEEPPGALYPWDKIGYSWYDPIYPIKDAVERIEGDEHEDLLDALDEVFYHLEDFDLERPE